MRILFVLLPVLVAMLALFAAYRVGVEAGMKQVAKAHPADAMLDSLLLECAQHAALGEPFAITVADEIMLYKNRATAGPK